MNSQEMTIYFVGAPAGAGKTLAMAHDAHSGAAAGGNILIVLPTRDLMNEVVPILQASRPPIKPELIHGGVVTNVVAAILATLNRQPSPGGRIVIITWSAFKRLPFIRDRQSWTVYVDEIPQICGMLEAVVPVTHAYVSDHIRLEQQGPEFSRVHVTGRASLRRLAKTTDDSLKSELAPMARLLISAHNSVYTRTASVRALLSGRGKKLTLHYVLSSRMFDGFRRVVVIGAGFGHTLLSKLWTAEGAIFVRDKELERRLRYTQHPNGNLATTYLQLSNIGRKLLVIVTTANCSTPSPVQLAI